jgi:hypothetical protein
VRAVTITATRFDHPVYGPGRLRIVVPPDVAESIAAAANASPAEQNLAGFIRGCAADPAHKGTDRAVCRMSFGAADFAAVRQMAKRAGHSVVSPP